MVITRPVHHERSSQGRQSPQPPCLRVWAGQDNWKNNFFEFFFSIWRGWADHAFDSQVEEEEEGLNNRDEGVGCCGFHMEFWNDRNNDDADVEAFSFPSFVVRLIRPK